MVKLIEFVLSFRSLALQGPTIERVWNEVKKSLEVGIQVMLGLLLTKRVVRRLWLCSYLRKDTVKENY